MCEEPGKGSRRATRPSLRSAAEASPDEQRAVTDMKETGVALLNFSPGLQGGKGQTKRVERWRTLAESGEVREPASEERASTGR